MNSVSSNGVLLAACSDRGTTHLYNIANSVAQSQTIDKSNAGIASSGASSGAAAQEELKQS